MPSTNRKAEKNPFTKIQNPVRIIESTLRTLFVRVLFLLVPVLPFVDQYDRTQVVNQAVVL